MIANKDRSGYIGASDTSFVVGNWETKTFKKWWLEKLGLRQSNVTTKAMKVGTEFEHKILDTISGIRKDHQIIIPELKLRVNYDGDMNGVPYEVKTHKNEFKISKQYWRQVQVEMFAMGSEKAVFVAYQVTEQEYKNYFTPIDKSRITFREVEYDEEFIEDEYLPKLKILAECMEDGRMPK